MFKEKGFFCHFLKKLEVVLEKVYHSMDPVQPRIYLIYTTNNEKNLAPKVCSKKKMFKSTFRVSSQISVDLHISIMNGTGITI